jgi:hypothetical protein
MTQKVGNTFFIEGEDDGICQMCGKKDELRPYGPGGMNVCFDCAMKDEEEARRQFIARLGGPSEVGRH